MEYGAEARSPAYKIARRDLPALLGPLSESGDVYAPAYEDGVAVFTRVGAHVDRVAWNFPRTVIPPKALFLPQTEGFARYRRNGNRLTIEADGEVRPAVLLGARPCDLVAVDMLMGVMLGDGMIDRSFSERRDRTTTVAVACEHEGEYCLCGAFGLTPGSTRGADAILYPDGDQMCVVSVTPRGRKVVATVQRAFVAAGMGLVPIDEGYVAEVAQRFFGNPRVRSQAVEAAERMMESDLEAPYWSEAAERCLSCGICTYICPTCYCFAIVDRSMGETGTRSRCWDACTFQWYSAMAGGHDPRATSRERIRWRFMHKMVHHRQRYGEPLCVGCGRCVEKCPVGLNVADVIEAFGTSPYGGAEV